MTGSRSLFVLSAALYAAGFAWLLVTKDAGAIALAGVAGFVAICAGGREARHKPAEQLSLLNRETIPCPYCGSPRFSRWTAERGFTVARCASCSLLYVNPRPVERPPDAKERRIPRKVRLYRDVLSRMFADVWERGEPISWLDVGAGYGEVIEAVSAIAPAGSRIEGVEPMRAKADAARAQGLNVTHGYLHPSDRKFSFISAINVFSHIPDFPAFLSDMRASLQAGGEVFIETGNLADLNKRSEYPGELDVPEHLVFAGEKHLRGYLDQAGFDVITVERIRQDTLMNVLVNAAKRLRGYPTYIRLPYISPYRQIMIRARLRAPA